jgi:hypothetical protein
LAATRSPPLAIYDIDPDEMSVPDGGPQNEIRHGQYHLR